MDPIIHIVEDDKVVLSAVSLLLSTFGWATRGFTSAEKYLENAGDEIPACLVLDLHMPGMNGAQLQQTLMTRGHAFPTVVVTGIPGSPLAVQALAAGARSVVAKPFRGQHLKNAIESAIGASAIG